MSEARIAEGWCQSIKKGYARLTLLYLLSLRPLHGYELMKEVRTRTLGVWRLTPGAVYPLLRELEVEGYVEGGWVREEGRRRKVYRATDRGREVLKVAIERQGQVSEALMKLYREFAHEVLGVGIGVEAAEVRLIPHFLHLPKIVSSEGERIAFLKERKGRLEEAVRRLKGELRRVNRELKAIVKAGGGLGGDASS